MLYAVFCAPQAVPGAASAAFKYQRGSGLLGKEPEHLALGGACGGFPVCRFPPAMPGWEGGVFLFSCAGRRHARARRAPPPPLPRRRPRAPVPMPERDSPFETAVMWALTLASLVISVAAIVWVLATPLA